MIVAVRWSPSLPRLSRSVLSFALRYWDITGLLLKLPPRFGQAQTLTLRKQPRAMSLCARSDLLCWGTKQSCQLNSCPVRLISRPSQEFILPSLQGRIKAICLVSQYCICRLVNPASCAALPGALQTSSLRGILKFRRLLLRSMSKPSFGRSESQTAPKQRFGL